MKAVILLLATAVAFAYGSTHPNILSIISQVDCLRRETGKTEEFDRFYVKDLKKNKIDNCEAEFFCQAEKVLFGVNLSNVNDKCHVEKLRRNLREYNNGVNCSVPTNGDEIIFPSFLENLSKCAKKVNFRPLKQKNRA